MTFTCVFGVLPATAQVHGGEIDGRVTDAAGVHVQGAAITLTGEALIEPRTGQTSRTGWFLLAAIPPGRYLLSVVAVAGERIEREVVVETGARLELSLVLHSAGPSQPGARPAALLTGETSERLPGATGRTFDRSWLGAVPSGRDPWAVIGHTAGTVVEPVSSGGAYTRFQPVWESRGSAEDPLWNVDGATLTDLTAESSLLYYDYGAIAEMRIQTGGHDAGIQTGGTNVNIVMRSGGDSFRGEGRWLWSGRALEDSNLSAERRSGHVSAGDPLVAAHEAGAQIGGPIRRGRAWFFVAYAGRRIETGMFGFPKDQLGDPYDPDNLMRETTTSGVSTLRFDLRPARSHTLTVFAMASNKSKNPVDARPTDQPETWPRQIGSSPVVRLSHDWAARPVLVTTRAAYTDGGFRYDLQHPEQWSIQPAVTVPSGGWSRSGRSTVFTRRMLEVKTDGSALGSSRGWGDHGLKFGFRYRRDLDGEMSHIGGYATANFWKGTPTSATLYREADERHTQWTWSVYLSDTISANRLGLTAGVRLDRQADRLEPVSAPANPLAPWLLPSVDFPGAAAPVAYFDLAPRVVLAWDLGGDARSVIRVRAGQYHGAGITVSRWLAPSWPASITWPWIDGNHDLFVQANELPPNIYYGPSPDSAADPEENRFDPDHGNDRTRELLAGFERRLGARLHAGATFIWRRGDRFFWARRNGVRSSDYVAVTVPIERCEGGRCGPSSQTVTYFDLPFPPPPGYLVTNRDAHRSYRGLEVGIRRPYDRRFRFDATLTLGDTRMHYHGPDSYQDPTRIPFEDGAQTGTQNSRWVLKVTAVAALPWELVTSVFLSARQGHPLVESIHVPYRRYIGPTDVPLEPIGSARYDSVWQLDWKIGKEVRVGRARLAADLEVFNLTNAATVLRRQTTVNEWDAGFVQGVLPPRCARIGVRVAF